MKSAQWFGLALALLALLQVEDDVLVGVVGGDAHQDSSPGNQPPEILSSSAKTDWAICSTLAAAW